MNRIKQLRTEKGMRQTELAKILKIGQATMSNWETGRSEPDYDSGGCQRCRKAVSGQRVYRNMWCESYRMFFDACLKEMQEVAASVPHI